MAEATTDELAELVESELGRHPTGSLEMRVACNRLRRILDTLDPPPPPVESPAPLLPMTDGEAEAFGFELMAFGKHFGEHKRDVPREYLAWLADEQRKEWRQLRRYLMHGEKIEHDE